MANYKNNIPFIKQSEGGLSSRDSDTASNYRSPYVVNGERPHTNKGITFQAFESLAPKIGYAVNRENFLTMPDKIWYPVYKVGYWDTMYGDDYKSQVVADYVSEFAWGSGVYGATKALKKFLAKKGITATSAKTVKDELNKLSEKNEKKLFEELIAYKKEFFRGLNQPANIEGWLTRTDKFYAKAKNDLGTTSKSDWVGIAIIAGVVIVVAIGGYVIYKNRNKLFKS